MERRRITLDNPAFAGTLRHERRSVAYTRRNLQPTTISDIVVARAPKPKPKHSGTVAKAVHSPRPKPAASRSNALVKPAMPVVNALNQQREPRKWSLSFNRQTSLYAMAVMVFIFGLAVAFNGLVANHKVNAQVKQVQKTASSDTGGVTDTPPSTEKPSAEMVRNYAVAPNVPRYVDIPKLNIHTRVLSMGVDKKNELQVPWNIYDTGWYNASAQPGQNGAMLVDGHSGIGNQHGVFYRLASLTAGDPITVTRGDGKTVTYKVIKVQTVNVKDVDMSNMLVSADTAKPGLNLITCTGDQIPGTTELNKRVLLYAVQQ